MSGVYIPGMKKPEECGHHLDRYKSVLNCPLALSNGACKLQQYEGRKRPNFREQYERCPLIGVPDHGPLFDMERTKEISMIFDDKGHLKEIGAPVIIPADKEGEKTTW